MAKKPESKKTTVEQSKKTYNPDMGASTEEAAVELEKKEDKITDADIAEAAADVDVRRQDTVEPADRPVGTYAETTVKMADGSEIPSSELASDQEEASWGVDVWLEVSKQRIGVERYVIAGALVGQDKDAQYTEREIRRLVENFLNTPIR